MQELLSKYPNFSALNCILGHLHYNNDRYEEALDIYSQCDSFRDQFSIILAEGFIFFETGDKLKG